MTYEVLASAGVFLVVYALIVTDRIHRTLAALLGAVVVMALGLINQHEALSEDVVDFNVIFLLAGMMIIANILGKTGIFQWLAVEAVRRAEGRPYRLLVLISLLTAITSAFLDNVTTVVLTTPVTFFIAQRLGASPVPFLISQILASNIGGTATLIGDPPNIIIGSRLGKDFNDFLLNAAPAAIASLAVYLVFARWLFRSELAQARALEPEEIQRLVREDRRIEDPRLLRLGLVVLAGTIVGFLLARPLGLEGATIALGGAVVLLDLLAAVLAFSALLRRSGRALGVERQQFKWFMACVALAFAVVAVGGALYLADSGLAKFVISNGVAAIPICLGVAILRYRLYDIDLFIKRTVVYGGTSVAIALTFFLGILALQALLRPLTAGSELAIAASTLVSLALLQPVRRRVQNAVDRRFDRARHDAARTIEAFAEQLRDEVDLDAR